MTAGQEEVPLCGQQCTKRSTVLNRTSLSLLLTSVPGRLMELRGHMAHATCCKQGRRGCKDKFKVDNNNNKKKEWQKYSTYALTSALYKIVRFIHILL